MINKRVEGTKTIRFGAVTSCTAECKDCDMRWEEYPNARELAREHSVKTGHIVKVEEVRSFTYVPKGD